MKILLKSAAVTALLLGSGLTQAATTTSSIPMGVDVPRSCTLSNVSAGIILPEDGSEAQGAFTLTCNIDGGFNATYSFDSKSNSSKPRVVNANGVGLETSGFVEVDGWNLSLDSGSQTLYFLATWLGRPATAIVKAKLKSPTTATTPAGVYTDTFRVNVMY
ncbi:hypothetical protein HX005_07865 [Acinetobacter sp. R933-2]|uniref:hypothetical protein n=1 Tax=Acinetobacter TaxID=469 RepID=UPI00257574C6|nr:MULTISPECIES: hypothetical protein [Acinetobacter]MDM1247303.1 hypothetical protein [Acinetobacter sp. R933-2]MDQ9022498.1 hypothetical protein [Acinetobacter sichuanensis]